MTPKHLATTMAALARAALPPGAALPAASVLSAGQPAGNAPQGAMPSQAGAGNMAGIVDALNAAHGLRPGPNPSGPLAALSRPASRSRGIASPEELAAKINAEHGLHAGPNVPPALAAHFAMHAKETI